MKRLGILAITESIKNSNDIKTSDLDIKIKEINKAVNIGTIK